jgi:hypothetical protein
MAENNGTITLYFEDQKRMMSDLYDSMKKDTFIESMFNAVQKLPKDCVLITENKTIQAHKAILAAGSTFFKVNK